MQPACWKPDTILVVGIKYANKVDTKLNHHFPKLGDARSLSGFVMLLALFSYVEGPSSWESKSGLLQLSQGNSPYLIVTFISLLLACIVTAIEGCDILSLLGLLKLSSVSQFTWGSWCSVNTVISARLLVCMDRAVSPSGVPQAITPLSTVWFV